MKKKKMFSGAPFLGKIKLHWCDVCNLPILDNFKCDICGNEPRKVDLTPPGDPFPIQGEFLKKVRNVIDELYGTNIGLKLLPDDKIILANKSPSQEGMYEIIVDGYVIGKLKYNIYTKKNYFSPTLEGARRLSFFKAKKWILCADDVIPYILNGASLLIPGILDLDPSIKKDDDVYLINNNGGCFAVGRARLSYDEIREFSRGVAVKIREYASPKKCKILAGGRTLSDAIQANLHYIEDIENKAINFIQKTKNKFNLPHVVAFSGGKDSLATFLLVRKALGRAPILFLNTGIEFPETLEYVKQIHEKYNEDLIMTDANKSFWNAVKLFGPPARDYRWCCKVVKFGPASLKLRALFNTKVLTFVGQRRYESFKRSKESKISQNIWVREQISVSPIKDWTALDVFLYSMREGAELNPLYSQGFPRIGCWLCPASSLEEFEFLRITHPALYEKWFSILKHWKDVLNYPDEWIEFGIWRWRHAPGSVLAELKKRNISLDEAQRIELTGIHFSIVNQGETTYEIHYNRKVDPYIINNILSIFNLEQKSQNTFSNNSGMTIEIFDNIVKVSFPNVDIKYIARAIQRKLGCQGCGVCVSSCPFNALEIVNNKIHVKSELCTGCLECDNSPCPTYLK